MYNFFELARNGLLLSLPEDKVTTINCYGWALGVNVVGTDLDPGFTLRCASKDDFHCMSAEYILKNVKLDLSNLGFRFSFQTTSPTSGTETDIVKVFYTPPIVGKREQGSYHFMRRIPKIGWSHKPGWFLQPQPVESFYGYQVQKDSNSDPIRILVHGHEIIRVYEQIGCFILYS